MKLIKSREKIRQNYIFCTRLKCRIRKFMVFRCSLSSTTWTWCHYITQWLFSLKSKLWVDVMERNKSEISSPSPQWVQKRATRKRSQFIGIYLQTLRIIAFSWFSCKSRHFTANQEAGNSQRWFDVFFCYSLIPRSFFFSQKCFFFFPLLRLWLVFIWVFYF